MDLTYMPYADHDHAWQVGIAEALGYANGYREGVGIRDLPLPTNPFLVIGRTVLVRELTLRANGVAKEIPGTRIQRWRLKVRRLPRTT